MVSTTLKERAYDEIRLLILSGEYAPGDFLTERTLVEKLSMSRTPIRSALERMQVEGLVNYTPNKGLVVAELSIGRAVDVYDLRVAVEAHMVSKLAQMAWLPENTELIRQNLEMQKECVNNKDLQAFTQLDSQFHLHLAKIYGNQEIIQTMEKIQDKLYQIAVRVLQKQSERLKVSYDDHQTIFELIQKGNGASAAEAMTKHLEYGKQILIS